MQRERKRRLVYGLWGLVAGLVLLGALPTFWANRWPRPLARDQIYLVTRMGPQELVQFNPQAQGEVSRRPWSGQLIVVPGADALVTAGIWQYSGWEQAELVRFLPSDSTPHRRIRLGQPYAAPVFTPDGSQIQAHLFELDRRLIWLDLSTGARQEAATPCEPFMIRLLPPLQRDEAILLCLWELWAVTPTSERPLLTTSMGSYPESCLVYAGRPFGVGIDQTRKRLWLTGEGGLLCQVDPRTGALRSVANLPIQESERVDLTDLQHAPATDLLYIGVHQWDTDQIQRILVWDPQQNRLRTEIHLSEPLAEFRPSSDGAHLIGLSAIRPGEAVTRVIVIEVATGTMLRELGQIKGGVLDWAVLPE